jgi:hypothetical protein
MSPVTEQLIRDYLSRLSIAARGQLAPDDRRALVDRTRDFIERQLGPAGQSTAFEVARLLFGLGDPAELVQQERQRLAAVRGDLPEPPVSRNPIGRMLRRDASKPRGPSWHWPAAPGGRTSLQLAWLESGGGNSTNGTARHGAASDNGAAGADEHSPQTPEQRVRADWFFRAVGEEPPTVNQPAAPMADDSAPAHDSVTSQLIRPAWPLAVNGAAGPSTGEIVDADWHELAGADGDDLAGAHDGELAGAHEGELVDPDESDLAHADGGELAATDGGDLVDADWREFTGADEGDTGIPAPTGVSPAWQLTIPDDPLLPRLVRRAWSAFAAWYRNRPLEASAVVLLGLGGVLYPPVWLLGAIVALASRLWDGRDKWVGLALPILLTIVAVAVGVAVGGHASVGHGVHEGWVFGVIGSRVAAVLSAAYLAWRSLHERRPPAVPPWNRPHKVG